MTARIVCAAALCAAAIVASVKTERLPQDLGAAGAWQKLLKLQTTASAMHTTAHPDDEHGGTLALLSRGAGARVSLTTLTRGESGDNAIGPELFDAVGLIRTEELRRAGEYYGLDRQYFTTVVDYGFSKRLDETLEKWGKDAVLRDLVAIIRIDRPLVLISRFQGNARDGHGNHQAAGLVTQDAFKAAGDPNMEAAPPTATDTYRLSDVDLASRLSYFLWGTLPDQDLLKAATDGTLRNSAVFDRQVARMIADPRSRALSTRFAAQWLRLQDVDKVRPDGLLFPNWDGSLTDAFVRETELFFDSLVRENRSVLDLITADYTFVNERLARHYGIPNVTGPEFRRVTGLPDSRRGLLTQGSVLLLTSVADRTSPVQRGKWVLQVLLGSPPPPPPPNVPALEDTKGSADGRFLSVRERMEQHRSNPACTSCHRVIDPIGLALEHYDVVGRYRIKDNGVPVDSTGTLYDGTAMSGADGLRTALLKHREAFIMPVQAKPR